MIAIIVFSVIALYLFLGLQYGRRNAYNYYLINKSWITKYHTWNNHQQRRCYTETRKDIARACILWLPLLIADAIENRGNSSNTFLLKNVHQQQERIKACEGIVKMWEDAINHPPDIEDLGPTQTVDFYREQRDKAEDHLERVKKGLA